MADTIRRIHRLLENRERLARLDLVRAEQARADQETAVQHVKDAIHAAREAPVEDAGSHAQSQVYVLKMEMARRTHEHRLIERQREVGRQREAVVAAAKEARSVELVAEHREERAAEDIRTHERKELDEHGLQGWWRKEA